MSNHSFNIIITTDTLEEANQKAKALSVIVAKLTAKELTAIAHLLTHDPVKAKIAKSYLT